MSRRPGPPCRHDGQYYRQGPESKRQHRSKTHHLKALVKYVEREGVLDTHDDVPDSLREQLHAEEDQQREKRKKSPDNSIFSSRCPPININVLPAGSSQQSMPTSAGDSAPAKTGYAKSITVHGLLDVAVEEYTEWQRSRVRNEAFSNNVNKARDVTLENCLDLIQIYEDQDPSFLSSTV